MSILNDLDFCGGALFPINPDATAKLLDVRAKALDMDQAVHAVLSMMMVKVDENQQELICIQPAQYDELKRVWLRWQK